MSRFECPEAIVEEPSAECAVELQLKPRTRDLGGFQVRRALPSAQRQMVGPFIA
jgi:redox-sensitive bicupin YhaK (pirin superfamily)